MRNEPNFTQAAGVKHDTEDTIHTLHIQSLQVKPEDFISFESSMKLSILNCSALTLLFSPIL